MSLPKQSEALRAFRLIDQTALIHNVFQFQRVLGPSKIMAVVKANAYGHGATLVAPWLEQNGIDCFAVATLNEAIALRKANLSSRIIILGYVHPSMVETIISYDLTITLMDAHHAQRIRALHRCIDCVLAIDTGMHRIGIPWYDQKTIETIIHDPYLHIVHVYSHLCDSESLKNDALSMTRLQQQRFDSLVKRIRTIDGSITFSLAATYGVLNHPDMHYDYARIGVGLYGIQYVSTALKLDLRPVLSMYSHIVHIQDVNANESIGYCQLDKVDHERTIATVSIGYVDGLTKQMRCHDLYIDDHPVKIVGNICMDQCMIDVTGLPVHIDQAVEIIGKHQSVVALSDGLTTQFLELLCNIDTRVPSILV